MDVEKSVLKEVFAQIKKDRELILRTLADLVEIPSVVGNEGPAQEMLDTMYRDLQLYVDKFTADEVDGVLSHPAYCGLEDAAEANRYRNRPNVVGTLSGEEDAPSPDTQWSYRRCLSRARSPVESSTLRANDSRRPHVRPGRQ